MSRGGETQVGGRPLEGAPQRPSVADRVAALLSSPLFSHEDLSNVDAALGKLQNKVGQPVWRL